MPVKPRLPDIEFIELWKKTRSTIEMVKLTGLTERAIRKRKRSLQERYEVDMSCGMLVSHDKVEIKLTVHNGQIIIINDQHFWPDYVPTMHRAFCYLARELKPAATIWNGDAFDGASISRFPSIGWENKPSVFGELQAVKDRAAEVMNASPNSKRIWTAGNHDLRFESRLAANAAEYKHVQGIHLKDHIPEFLPAWYITVNGDTPSHTEIRHRERGGVHASYNNTLHSGITIVTGHDHIADIRPFSDRRGMRYGVRTGMGADSARDQQFVNYLEGRTPSWQSAMCVLTYRDGMLLMPELALRIDEDRFQFRGEIIRV